MRDELIDEKIRQDILDTKLAEAEELEELERSCPCSECKDGPKCDKASGCLKYDNWEFERQLKERWSIHKTDKIIQSAVIFAPKVKEKNDEPKKESV